MTETLSYEVGDHVVKTSGDYIFDGEIVSIFRKQSGATRVVVEDNRGLLFIFNPTQLQRIEQ